MAKVEKGSQLSNGDFLEVASQLRKVLEARPDDFLSAANGLGVSRRKAYYLVEVDKAFSDLKVDRARLGRIGWTKLHVLASRVTRRNVDHLLTEAERLSVYELSKTVNDEPASSSKSHVVLLRFTDDEYEVFRRTVRAFGAEDSSTGLSGKEQALIAALRKVKK